MPTNHTVWTLPSGDYCHSPGEIPRDLEEHSSLGAAKNAFWRYCDDPYEMTDETTSWYVYKYDPTSEDNGPGDPYPDFRLYLGPRGGVRMEPC